MAVSQSVLSTCSCVSPSVFTDAILTVLLKRRSYLNEHLWTSSYLTPSYNLMSERYFTHASPTLFNAGTPNPQLSSCFLVTMKDDSIEGIYDTLKTCAMISKTAGGIGLNIHCIRATGYAILIWAYEQQLTV